jgi:hypothetical protein
MPKGLEGHSFRINVQDMMFEALFSYSPIRKLNSKNFFPYKKMDELQCD